MNSSATLTSLLYSPSSKALAMVRYTAPKSDFHMHWCKNGHHPVEYKLKYWGIYADITPRYQDDIFVPVWKVCSSPPIVLRRQILIHFWLYSLKKKIWMVLNATRTHARNLAYFAVVYKSSMWALKYIGPTGWGKEGPYDTFLAGLLGGYLVFGRSPGDVSLQVSKPNHSIVFQEACRLTVDFDRR